MRRKLEPRPLNSMNFASQAPYQQAPSPHMATCHHDRRYLARGYCYRCYHKLRSAGAFERNPNLRATAAL